MSADLPEWEQYPQIIKETRQRPDIVFHSPASKRLIMIELTVPYEARIEEANIYKKEKYLDLGRELKKKGYESEILPIEIGARGFVGASAYNLLTKLSLSLIHISEPTRRS